MSWKIRYKCVVCGRMIGKKPWIFGTTLPSGATKLRRHKQPNSKEWCAGAWSTTDNPKMTP